MWIMIKYLAMVLAGFVVIASISDGAQSTRFYQLSFLTALLLYVSVLVPVAFGLRHLNTPTDTHTHTHTPAH